MAISKKPVVSNSSNVVPATYPSTAMGFVGGTVSKGFELAYVSLDVGVDVMLTLKSVSQMIRTEVVKSTNSEVVA
jgi:hypothetical protein